jgi:hypothetical protein
MPPGNIEDLSGMCRQQENGAVRLVDAALGSVMLVHLSASLATNNITNKTLTKQLMPEDLRHTWQMGLCGAKAFINHLLPSDRRPVGETINRSVQAIVHMSAHKRFGQRWTQVACTQPVTGNTWTREKHFI